MVKAKWGVVGEKGFKFSLVVGFTCHMIR
uniref:Uncharacterized protein n=1 Tax=Arundo donax TaxID=35708 RepID=A0A0A8ZFF7_ARUDO